MDRKPHLEAFHSYGFRGNPSVVNTEAADSLLFNNQGRLRAGVGRSVAITNNYDSGTKYLEATSGVKAPQYGVAEQNQVRWYGSRASRASGQREMVNARSQAITSMLGGVKDE